jgi:hypothetical protein
MRQINVIKLNNQLAILADELSQLEAKRDQIVQKRCAATTSEEKRKCSREAGGVFAAMSKTQRRIRGAKRLLARAEGDEYSFVG